jgi:hypothetical protein
LALSAGLSACGQDARSVRLGDVDLTKSATVRDVRERLSPADRPAFAIYVTRHLVYGAGFCGQRLTDTEGREPATVGEAIDQTRAREVVIAAAARQERRTLTPAEQTRSTRQALIERNDQLISRQALLSATKGPAAERSAEWQTITDELSANRASLSK